MKKVLFLISSLFFFSLLLLGGIWFFRQKQTQKRQDNLLPQILEISKRHNLRPSLVLALIKKESSFQVNVRGSFEEYGLMQIREPVADDWCREHKRPNFKAYGILLKPEMNLEIGTWYLAKAVRRWKGYKYQEQIALAQYNAGPGRVKDWVPPKKNDEFLSRISIASTRDYILKIQAFEKEFAELLEKDLKKILPAD